MSGDGSSMRLWRRLGGLAAAAVWAGSFGSGQPVRAWTDQIHLATYRTGDAVAVPDFSAWTSEPSSYPYPPVTALGQQAEDRIWRTLNLENEYLLCRVLPDLGGHLYSCRDKRNGREMFYANPVVRPGLVGLRGAWVALGIESNFPFGHTRVNMSPVDFAVGTGADGSARAVVEDTDRVTGMQWRVEFVLRPASTVLEQRVLLYNRSPVRWPYYWWSNAEVTFDDPATRLVLPAHVAETHTTPAEIVAWPVKVNGKDGAVVANHKDAAAWFAYGSHEPFFAIYKPGSRSGVAHYADPAAVPGKKLWMWGADQDRWVEDTLTRNFPSYVEIQAGVFGNQSTLGFLQPEEFRSFSEYWIPVFDAGGVVRVTRDAVANLERRSDPAAGPALLVELSATHPIKDARIRVSADGKDLLLERADLDPASTYRHLVAQAPESPATLELLDSQGAVLLRHIENRYDAMEPGAAPLGKVAEPEWKKLDHGDEGYFLGRGEFAEISQQWGLAFENYRAGVERFPASKPLLKALGRFELNLNRFNDAARVLAQSAGDAETIYELGVAQAMAGNDSDAAATFSRVAPDSAFHAPAELQVAYIAARAHDDSAALAHLAPLVARPSGPVRAGALEVAVLRRSGRVEEAKTALDKWLAADPADSMLRFEATRLGRTDTDLWSHLAADSERVLNVVDEYLSLGMESEAVELLGHAYPPVSSDQLEPGAVPTALSPMIVYYRAYSRMRLGQDASADWRTASQGFTRYLFPFRASSQAVLAAALKANEGDALAHLLMARLLLDRLDAEGAVEEWESARLLDPKLPEAKEELEKTLASVISRPAPATNEPAPTDPIGAARAALQKAAAGDAPGAAGLFDARVFSAEKQPEEVRRDYIEVQLQKVQSTADAGQCPAALDLLEHLGGEDSQLGFTLYGFDSFMKAPHFQYFAAGIEAGCGAMKDARKRWTKLANLSEPVASAEFVFPALAAAKLKPQEGASRLAAATAQVTGELARADAASRPRLVYARAMLEEASGAQRDALKELQQLLTVPADGWIRYLAAVEVRQILHQPDRKF